MNQRTVTLTVLVACLLLLGSKAVEHGFVETWIHPDRAVAEFRKVAVVGISADQEIRHRFEDRFVSHLRGRKYEAVTSYSLVDDLAVVADRQALIDSIQEQRIDGVLSVRLVRLTGQTEESWSAAWNESLESAATLRSIIDESLPHTGEQAKSYGVEVSLWDTQRQGCVWSARTVTYDRKSLRKGVAGFVQTVMDELEDQKLL